MKLCMVMHTFNPNSWKAGGSLRSRKATPVYKETLPQINKLKINKNKVSV